MPFFISRKWSGRVFDGDGERERQKNERDEQEETRKEREKLETQTYIRKEAILQQSERETRRT